MVIAFDEDQAPAGEEVGDEPQEESFEDEEHPPIADYASDNAADPPEVEGRRPIITLEEWMCRAVHTPTNSTVARICGRTCSGYGSYHRKVPAPHALLRKSPMTRADVGVYTGLP